jgi:hypothetical protein
MSKRRLIAAIVTPPLLLAAMIALPGCGEKEAPLDAATIIDRYFEAVGGRAALESLGDMVIHGRYGHVFAPGDTMTLYIKKPYSIRRETFGRIVSFDGAKGYINSFGDLTEAEGDNMTSLRYYAGFFHSGFSLLKFGDGIEQARYVGEGERAGQREHVVIIPHEGTDYWVHFHADSYLIDRIVFPFGNPEEGTRMVNSLDNYREVNGVMMPSEVVFDIVGREAAPMKLEPLVFEPADDLDPSLFSEPQLDIEPAVLQEGVLISTIYDDSNGILLTTVRKADMEKLGIAPGEFMTFEVEGETMSVRYVENIHSGFKGAQLGDYIAIYYQTPLLAILLFGEGDLRDVFNYEKGQEIRIWPTEKAEG